MFQLRPRRSGGFCELHTFRQKLSELVSIAAPPERGILPNEFIDRFLGYDPVSIAAPPERGILQR